MKAGYDVAAHDELKTAPRGYAKDHPRIALLRRKGLVAGQSWPVAAWLHTAKAKARVEAVVAGLRAAQRLAGRPRRAERDGPARARRALAAGSGAGSGERGRTR